MPYRGIRLYPAYQPRHSGVTPLWGSLMQSPLCRLASAPSCSAGLLVDPTTQSQYCREQGGGGGGSRLALCVDTYSRDACNASSTAGAAGAGASRRRQYIGRWAGGGGGGAH